MIMFQESFFNDEISPFIPPVEAKLYGIDQYFTGTSLLHEGVFKTLVGSGKNAANRETKQGNKCCIYRNLNKPSFFSIKQMSGELKNKVSGYARSVVITNPQFRVSEASRQRVLREGRNVHAYIFGDFENAYDGDIQIDALTDYIRITYSPYVGGYFFTLQRDNEGRMVKDSITRIDDASGYRYAVANGADIILFNP